MKQFDSKNKIDREKLGQISTPRNIATDIVEAALSYNRDNITFLDPAFGLGSFYEALIHQVKPKTALGIEIDPYYGIAAAQHWAAEDIKIRISDFLKLKPIGLFNLLISHPPFSINNFDFVYSSHDWLEENAISAWLITTKLNTDMLTYLLNEVNLLRIHFYEERKFPIVIIFKKENPKNDIIISDNGSLVNYKKINKSKNLKQYLTDTLF